MRSDEASAAGDQISRHGEVRVSKERADLRVGRSISERRSQPVSRILSAFVRHSAPCGARRRTSARRSFLWDRDCSRFLATYPVAFGRAVRQATPLPPYLVLLRAGFCLPPTLPPARCALTAPFHPYLADAPKARRWGGMFSVPLSVKLPCPGVTRRTALWSSDFPPAEAPKARRRAIVCLTATFLLSNPKAQIPKPKSQNPNPNSEIVGVAPESWGLGFGIWRLGFTRQSPA